MTGRSFTIELTDEQAHIVADMAEGQGLSAEAVLIEAIGHGLAMILSGVDLVEDTPTETLHGEPLAIHRQRDRDDAARAAQIDQEPHSVSGGDDDMPF